MQIFIAGCARSGTTLFRAQMRGLPATTVVPVETSFERFAQPEDGDTNVVMKRASKDRRNLHALPADVKLFYCVRHPYDVLTSVHPASSHERAYHVTPERWLEEYESLKRLQAEQPERDIFFVRYEDLIQEPADMQHNIEKWLGIKFDAPFSAKRKIASESLLKWRLYPERVAYLKQLPAEMTVPLDEFCRHFGYAREVSLAPFRAGCSERSNAGGLQRVCGETRSLTQSRFHSRYCLATPSKPDRCSSISKRFVT